MATKKENKNSDHERKLFLLFSLMLFLRGVVCIACLMAYHTESIIWGFAMTAVTALSIVADMKLGVEMEKPWE